MKALPTSLLLGVVMVIGACALRSRAAETISFACAMPGGPSTEDCLRWLEERERRRGAERPRRPKNARQ